MNIFVLDQSPTIAASYHCDQHLHKMILESAQMVSTALLLRNFALSGIYKLAYPKHPCTRWAAESNHNILWICELAMELESIRQSIKNCDYHSSSDVIKLVHDFIRYEFPCAASTAHTPFIFAGPAIISIRPGSTVDHYCQYYRKKHNNWLLDKGAGMTYKGRPVPDFMADLISPTI